MGGYYNPYASGFSAAHMAAAAAAAAAQQSGQVYLISHTNSTGPLMYNFIFSFIVHLVFAPGWLDFLAI
jgi:hypothetical protein